MVVPDSGIWISAIKFGGTPRRAILKAVATDQIAISDTIETEIIQIMGKKFNFMSSQISAAMDVFLEGAHRITITYEVQGICRDPKDDHVLECAKKAEASLIISGDKDLLALGSFEGIQIVTARQYVGKPEYS